MCVAFLDLVVCLTLSGRNLFLNIIVRKRYENDVEHILMCCHNCLLLCVSCVGAKARLDGPTAGKEELMEACGPVETVAIGKMMGTLTAETDTLTADMPGRSIRLQ